MPCNMEFLGFFGWSKNKCYSNLAENIDGTPASLVFNMDEAGEDDYVDTHS